MRAILSVALLIAFTATAAAQQTVARPKPDSEEAQSLAANYELTNADGTLRCPIVLETKSAGAGLALAFDRNKCNSLFGFLGEVAGWAPGMAGAILFVAPNGKVVAEFTEGVGGTYEAIRENDGVYFLANLQVVDPAQQVQVTELYGEWQFSAPDGPPICRIELSDDVAGDGIFVARVPSECDATIARFAPVLWQYERGDIVLRSKSGDSWRFEAQDSGVWTKVPDKPRPLVLSRP
jgi:hypothetical protein